MSPALHRAALWLAPGIALGLALALSPVTVLGLAVLVGLTAVGCSGLTWTERRIVVTVLVAAIGLRLLALVALFLSTDPYHLVTFSFEGDGWFLKQRGLWIRNVWLGTAVSPVDYQNAFGVYGWTSYIDVIAYIQYLLSPAPYAIHLFNVVCSLAFAIVLHRLVRWGYGVRAGLVALLVLLCLPTQFMWSVSALKEPLYVLLLASVVAALAVAGARGRPAVRVGSLALAVAGALMVASVRSGAQIIIALAFFIAVAGTFIVRRPYILLITLLAGPSIAARVVEVPVIHERVMTQLRTGASLHIGHVRTLGHGYKALDQRFYTFKAGDVGNPFAAMTWPEAARFAWRMAGSVLTVPTPAQITSRSEMLFLPQQFIWYGLLALAVVGLFDGSRRNPFLTWLLAGTACAGMLAIVLNSGNVGTLVRHRDSVVPFVVCLAAVGAATLLGRAGLFGASAAAAPPGVPSDRRHFDSRTSLFDRAASESFAIRIARGSVLCSALRAVLRQVPGYCMASADNGLAFDQVFHRLAASSRIVTFVGNGWRTIARAWRHSVAWGCLEAVQALPAIERTRIAGYSLLVGVGLATLAAPFGDFGWPAAFPAAVMATTGLALAFGAAPVVRAWQARS